MGLSASVPAEPEERACRVLVLGEKSDAALSELAHLPRDAEVVAVAPTIEELLRGDAAFSDANVLLVAAGSRATLSPVLKHLPHLVWVHSVSAGLDHLLCPALVEDETIVVTNAKGLFSSSLAEYVLAAAAFFAKDFPRLIRNQAERRWDRFCVQELRGACMGIVGYGNIGQVHLVIPQSFVSKPLMQACARLAKAYGMRVVGLRRCFPYRSCPPPSLISA